MMTTAELAPGLLDKLEDKEYRDAYVFEHICTGIPFQIRALRKQRGWNQEKLAIESGKRQGVISEIENEEEGRFQLRKLMDLASAFDVALLVKFVPYSKFLEETGDVSQSGLRAVSFAQELAKLRAANALKKIRDRQTASFFWDMEEDTGQPRSGETRGIESDYSKNGERTENGQIEENRSPGARA